MKLTFICGSLESGRDGVGDYTATLARELQKSGHIISILSLNDYYIESGLKYKSGFIDAEIAFIRLSSTCKLSERVKIAREWLWEFQPQWLSLQFVPFSFHKKGLPVFLYRILKQLGFHFRWHIMFHELWVGMPIHASKKHIFWGWIQRKIIKKMILQLNPEVIHTQCQLYHQQLVRAGSAARLLPLCSNIPVTSIADRYRHNDESLGSLPASIKLIIFGTIHPQALLTELLSQLSAFKNLYCVNFEMCLVGNCGEHQYTWLSQFQKAGIPVHILGQQTPEMISHLLSNADIGVSTSAVAMIGKSGTVAAMLAHKLPVLCVGEQWNARGIPAVTHGKGIHILHDDCIRACIDERVDVSSNYQVQNTAALFIKDLRA